MQKLLLHIGDELDPPIYGKVYIAIKTKTGSSLNDATKNLYRLIEILCNGVY